MKKIFKSVLSVILCGLLTVLSVPAVADGAESLTVLLNGVPLENFSPEKSDYEYKVEDLDKLPVITVNGTVGDLTVEQGCRENDYIGTVGISGSDRYRIRFYDDFSFQSHFINYGADPSVTYVDGWYYYMTTGNGFYISRSRDLSRLNSNPVSVFTLNELNRQLGFTAKELWAPELHYIDGYWYIYFTVYNGDSANGAKEHRIYAIKSDTADVFGTYSLVGQIREIPADYEADANYISGGFEPGHFAIDNTVFTYGGKMYTVWSGWQGYTNISQRIYIAEMSDPCTVSSARVELSLPQLAFETYSTSPSVNEGPQAVIAPDGTLNILYSANLYTDPHYSIGCLTLKKDGNPLCKEDWIKTDHALFETNEEVSTFSVGHASFVPSPDESEYYIVYHARRTQNSADSREIRIKKFFFCEDGTPYFGKAIAADEKVLLPAGTPKITRRSFEAEEMNLSDAVTVYDSSTLPLDKDFYSSGNMIRLTAKNATADFTVNVSESGNYTVSLLAAGKSATSSGFAVTVNGQKYLKKLGGNSNNIDNFFYYDLENIPLNAGENTVRIAYDSEFSTGGALDRVDVWCAADETAAIEKAALAKANAPVIFSKSEVSYSAYTSGKTYEFNSFSDFDKYWFSSTPFVDEYADTITTARPGGNKRMTVSDPELANVANFTASVNITPSAAHTYNGNVQVVDESTVNSGLIFRAANIGCGSASDCAFDGYRCFLIYSTSSKVLKIQTHLYRYASETAATATGTVLGTSTTGIPYVPGNTYVLSVSVQDGIMNATAYDTADPDTVVNLNNVNLYSQTKKFYSGKIGLFSNPAGGRVTFSHLKVTPTDLTLPGGCSKVITASQLTDFSAKAGIRIKNTNATVQTGFCFHVQRVTDGTPGLTGYAVFIQRTTSHAANTMVINLTKYGTKSDGTENANLGNQSFTDKNLLKDISATADIVGKQFIFEADLKGTSLHVKVTRADNPQIFSEFDWEINNPAFAMNKNYPVHYEQGAFGIFTNGATQITDLNFGDPHEPQYGISSASSQNGALFGNVLSAKAGSKVSLTVAAKEGYYIKKDSLKAGGVLCDYGICNSDNDRALVLSTVLPGEDQIYSCEFAPILPGDANTDGTVNVIDLIRLKKRLSDPEDIFGFSNSDIITDGKLNADDAVGLRKILLSNLKTNS